MKITIDSINKIAKNSTEFLIYGLGSCQYYEIADSLSKYGFKAYLGKSYPNIIEHNGVDILFEGCCIERDIFKAALTTLMIDNFQRKKLNQPFIQLIFCIKLIDNDKKIALDVERVINDWGVSGSVTASEIRRLYKMYSEKNHQFHEIIDETVNFVSLSKLNNLVDTYELKKISAPWIHADWNKKWEERQNKHIEIHKANQWDRQQKRIFWRDIAKTKISFFINTESCIRINNKLIEEDFKITNSV